MEDKQVTPKEKEESERQKMLRELRKNRIPVGIPTLNLDYPPREGYQRRVVCDRHGRLEKFIRAGWTFVQEDQLESKPLSSLKVTTRESVDGSVSQVVGTHKDNKQMVGYLMEIPEELYEEDQAVKMENIDDLESSLRAGRDADGGSGESRYIPKHTPIKIEQKGRRGGRQR